MAKWEYCFLYYTPNDAPEISVTYSKTSEAKPIEYTNFHKAVAELGDNGWELVSAMNYTPKGGSLPNGGEFAFKRPAEVSASESQTVMGDSIVHDLSDVFK